ncbi:MAG: thiamine diphosphokinase [Acidimicrobiia bacterium]|nr:thiamine diphosphokinase [Acidimicrobiia bacterium]
MDGPVRGVTPGDQTAPVPEVALVFAGGDPVPVAVNTRLPVAALVIGADSGIEHAHALGRRVDGAVGDFDSVAPETLAVATEAGAEVVRYPVDKDATDLELALDVATARGVARITVVGGHGGRFDHYLANALLLASPRFAAVEIDAWFGDTHVAVIRTRTRLTGRTGSLVTLLAIHGPARGVTTTGLRFPLHDADLLPGSTLGVSNELVGVDAEISVAGGTVLGIQPDALERS